MYYEETTIEGSIRYRTTPDGCWMLLNHEQLNKRVQQQDKNIKILEHMLDAAVERIEYWGNKTSLDPIQLSEDIADLSLDAKPQRVGNEVEELKNKLKATTREIERLRSDVTSIKVLISTYVRPVL